MSVMEAATVGDGGCNHTWWSTPCTYLHVPQRQQQRTKAAPCRLLRQPAVRRAAHVPEELAALELLEQEVEPRLVLQRRVEAHDRRVAQRAEELLLAVEARELRLALDVGLLDGLERVARRRAPVPHAQHAARHAAAEHTAELQVGQRRQLHPQLRRPALDPPLFQASCHGVPLGPLRGCADLILRSNLPRQQSARFLKSVTGAGSATEVTMSRKKPAVLGDEKTTEARTSQPGVVSAYAHSGMRGWRHHMEDSVVAEQAQQRSRRAA